MSENLNLKTIDTVDVSPFKKLVMTIGELPTSFVESMTYYEALAWFVNYLQNTIIPTVNNNAEAVEELQGLFTTLYNYVHDYFDNLDVQEEINNKLDEMAEDGTLQNMITSYLALAKTMSFETVADMIDSELIEDKFLVYTLGFYQIGDGGGCKYLITNSLPSTYYIPLKNSLYAIPVEPNIKQLGAKGTTDLMSSVYASLSDAQKIYPTAQAEDISLTVDTFVIRLSISNYIHNTKLPTGTFYVNDTITISTTRTEIYGEGKYESTIKYIVEEAENKYCFDLQSGSNIFKGFGITGPYTVSEDPSDTSEWIVNGLHLGGGDYTSSSNIFEDLRIRAFKWGISSGNNSYMNQFTSLRIDHCNRGFFERGQGGDYNLNNFTNCLFQVCDEGIAVSGGRTQVFIGCDFEGNNTGLRKFSNGDITLFNCYSEDHIKIQACDSALISGCSFWAGNAAATETPFIRYDGTAATKITIQNCDFVSRDAGVANCAVKQYNEGGSAVNPQTIYPTLIENTCTNMNLVDSSFRGNMITNGIVTSGSDKTGYLNLGNTHTYTLGAIPASTIRLAGTTGGNCAITLPTMTEDSIYQGFPTEYKIIVPPSTTGTSTFTIEVSDSSTQDIKGTTSFTVSDITDKILFIKYLGVISSKYTWATYLI